MDVDQSEGIISLITRLHQKGHRKIAFMTWVYSVATPWVMHRFGSYVEGLYQNNLEFDAGYYQDAAAHYTEAIELDPSGETDLLDKVDKHKYR